MDKNNTFGDIQATLLNSEVLNIEVKELKAIKIAFFIAVILGTLLFMVLLLNGKFYIPLSASIVLYRKRASFNFTC
jgi:hypothetical protein